QCSVGARFVLDDEGLTETTARLIGKGTGHHVSGAASRKSDDEANGMVRIGAIGGAKGQRERYAACERRLFHELSPVGCRCLAVKRWYSTTFTAIAGWRRLLYVFRRRHVCVYCFDTLVRANTASRFCAAATPILTYAALVTPPIWGL